MKEQATALVMEGVLTWGGERTIQYTDGVLQSRTPDTYQFIDQCHFNEVNEKEEKAS